MSPFVPVSEARASLSALIKQADDHDIVLMNHGRPAAILISVKRYDALLEEVEDLKDRVSVHERDGVTVSLDNLVAELGIADEVEEPDSSPLTLRDHLASTVAGRRFPPQK
ncbi:type II toxin-antitoxin system Phd/YefM family antitoxin [Mycolicibacterium sp. A43C]